MNLPRPGPLSLAPDARLLFLTRFTRLFAYGALAVILVFYVTQLGFTDSEAGLLLTCTLLGDIAISLWLTTRADRFGRRRTLIVGALLMAGAGVAFASVKSVWGLMIAGAIGVISPSGNEVGPFLAVEQAALAHVIPDRERTRVFAWYTLTGAVATALGSLAGGLLSQAGPALAPSVAASRRVVWLYAALGLVLLFLFARLSPSAEAAGGEEGGGIAQPRSLLGVSRSGRVVARLSALFAMDAFGGGFVVQSFVAYWFHLRFRTEPAMLGGIFFAANLLAGISALVASRLAAKIGLVKTMVYTHLPSNILLLCVPLMPTLESAIVLLWARFSISQMDVPTRQSYTMAIVPPGERSAVAGITGVARTGGAALAPAFAGALFNAGLINWPFFLAGTLKLCYDLLLYRAFVTVRPPEEEAPFK